MSNDSCSLPSNAKIYFFEKNAICSHFLSVLLVGCSSHLPTVMYKETSWKWITKKGGEGAVIRGRFSPLTINTTETTTTVFLPAVLSSSSQWALIAWVGYWYTDCCLALLGLHGLFVWSATWRCWWQCALWLVDMFDRQANWPTAFRTQVNLQNMPFLIVFTPQTGTRL